eukprot:TRINITY_DN24680_c0_g1_i1.p1 TRINITY_DN24680_c0_g1~~TRINITY_DN24680_c0_g1_i1.p1  ORF type:complete len:428 (+),score=26.13 TRINITY_DN24680_c0_g1_i1:127-1284(+)
MYSRDRNIILTKQNHTRCPIDYATMKKLRKVTSDENGVPLEKSLNSVVREALSQEVQNFLSLEENVGNETFALAAFIASRGRLSRRLIDYIVKEAVRRRIMTDPRVFDNLLGCSHSDKQFLLLLFEQHQFPITTRTYNSLIRRLALPDPTIESLSAGLLLYRNLINDGLYPLPMTARLLLNLCVGKVDSVFIRLGMDATNTDLNMSGYSRRSFARGKGESCDRLTGISSKISSMRFAETFSEATAIFDSMHRSPKSIEVYLQAASRVGTLSDCSRISLMFETRDSRFYIRFSEALLTIAKRFQHDDDIVKNCVSLSNVLLKEMVSHRHSSISLFSNLLKLSILLDKESMANKVLKTQESSGMRIAQYQKDTYRRYFGHYPARFRE